jgi:hypothetical protein
MSFFSRGETWEKPSEDIISHIFDEYERVKEIIRRETQRLENRQLGIGVCTS